MVVVHERGHGIHTSVREAGRPTLLLHSTGVGSIQWLRLRSVSRIVCALSLIL